MTRQQAKDHQLELCDSCLKDEALELIDRVYDSIEAMVCESCHYNKMCLMQKQWQELALSNMECADGAKWDKWSTPFGCNKFTPIKE